MVLACLALRFKARTHPEVVSTDTDPPFLREGSFLEPAQNGIHKHAPSCLQTQQTVELRVMCPGCATVWKTLRQCLRISIAMQIHTTMATLTKADIQLGLAYRFKDSSIIIRAGAMEACRQTGTGEGAESSAS